MVIADRTTAMGLASVILRIWCSWGRGNVRFSTHGKAFLWLSTATSEYRHLKQYEESATVHQHPISNSATTFQYRHLNLKQYEESATVHQHPISNSAASYTEMPKLDGVTRDTGQAHMVIYNSFIHHATQKAVAHKVKRLLELWHWSSLCTKTATESEKWLPESSHQFHSSTTAISQQSLPSAGGSSTLKSTQLWTKGMKDVWPHYTITVHTQWAAHWQNTQQEHRPQLWCCSWKLGLPPAGI